VIKKKKKICLISGKIESNFGGYDGFGFFSNFRVNISTCGDNNYIFVLVFVIGLLVCKNCLYNGNNFDKKKEKEKSN
jgi:hypothetical protein